MSDKIKKLLKAGLKISHLSAETLDKLEGLSDKEIDALAKICGKLTDKEARQFLVYSEWSGEQPPGPGPY